MKRIHVFAQQNRIAGSMCLVLLLLGWYFAAATEKPTMVYLLFVSLIVVGQLFCGPFSGRQKCSTRYIQAATQYEQEYKTRIELPKTLQQSRFRQLWCEHDGDCVISCMIPGQCCDQLCQVLIFKKSTSYLRKVLLCYFP